MSHTWNKYYMGRTYIFKKIMYLKLYLKINNLIFNHQASLVGLEFANSSHPGCGVSYSGKV